MHPKEPVRITEDIHVGAVCKGSAVVTAGNRVRVLGIVTGDLVVETDARADVFGEVRGDLHALGRVNLYDGAYIYGQLTGIGVRDRRTMASPRRRLHQL
jgi:cytoskeletal protein CcmA (bactofilin family)